MLSAVNPCGFAMLPAYLSVLVADGGAAGGRGSAVRRALACTAALTAGYVAVFGAFGLALAPAAGWLQPRLPWLTVGLGLLLIVLGGWLLAGRRLPTPGPGVRAPRLRRTVPSMVLFGMAYAVASLTCTIAPFLAIVVSSLRAGSTAEGVALFGAYAVGMGLVVGVTALAVAVVQDSVVSRLRRATALVPRLSGLVPAGSASAATGRHRPSRWPTPRSWSSRASAAFRHGSGSTGRPSSSKRRHALWKLTVSRTVTAWSSSIGDEPDGLGPPLRGEPVDRALQTGRETVVVLRRHPRGLAAALRVLAGRPGAADPAPATVARRLHRLRRLWMYVHRQMSADQPAGRARPGRSRATPVAPVLNLAGHHFGGQYPPSTRNSRSEPGPRPT